MVHIHFVIYTPLLELENERWKTGGTPLTHFREILTLFKTKICDFPYPISDLTQNSIPYFRPTE